MNNEILTLNELAEYLRVKPITIYKHAKQGKLPGFKVGERWRFRMKEIEHWIESKNILEQVI